MMNKRREIGFSSVGSLVMLMLVLVLMMNKVIKAHHEHNLSKHKCIHDELMQEEKDNLLSNTQGMKESQNNKRNILATETWSNLRVVFRTDYLGSNDIESRSCSKVDDYYWDGSATQTAISASTTCATVNSVNCWRVCTSNDIPTSDYLSYITNTLLPAVKEDFSRMAQVISVQTGEYTKAYSNIDRCGSRGGVPIPSDLKSNGFDGQNADVIMFVTSRPTQEGVLGWAVACMMNPSTSRPISGQLNLSPRLATYSNAEKLSVTRHESLHALGFSETFYQNFYDRVNKKKMDASSVYSIVQKTYVDSTGVSRSVNVTKLKSPKILDIARKYYNCPSLDGVQMEEFGGSGVARSHWEKRIMRNELMVGSIGGELYMSSFTIAYFEDSGWYRGNFSHSQKLTWGKDMGCEMADGRCENWSTSKLGYFCKDDPSIYSCSFDLKKKSYCGNTKLSSLMGYYEHIPSLPYYGGQDSLMDYCPLQTTFASGDCNSGYSSISDGEVFGSTSACFESSISLSSISKVKSKDSKCLKYSCDSETLNIYVGTTKFPCPKDQTPQTKTSSTFYGFVKCPQHGYDILCKNSIVKTSNYAINGVYVDDGATPIIECNGISSASASVCNGKGKCIATDNCQCFTGASGEYCSSFTCDLKSPSNSSVCGGQGTCVGLDNCACNTGYYGDNCEKYMCFGFDHAASNVCSSNGKCVGLDNCTCNTGYYGDNCEKFMCFGLDHAASNVCSSNGKCVGLDNCQCFTGASGQYCSSFTCNLKSPSNSSVCGGQGTCVGLDNCSCYTGYYGDNCEKYMCFGFDHAASNVCSSNGKCVGYNNCQCNTQTTNADCSISTVAPVNKSNPSSGLILVSLILALFTMLMLF